MRNELVSVIIPSYNRADKIGTAIESVLQQDHKVIQLIVVDDGSVDDTEKVMSRFPQVQYIKKDHAGQAAARNFGLQLCMGNFVATLDSDDAWKPAFVSSCLQKLENNRLDFVFTNWDQQLKDGGYFDFLSNDPFLKPYRQHPVSGWFNLDNTQLRSLYLKACPSPSSSALMRRSSIHEGWNYQIKIGDDWGFYLDMILFKKCKAAFTLEKMWTKQINNSNIYDGRHWPEVLQNLYIHDVGCFMERYDSVLNRSESGLLQKKYIRALVELANHRLFRGLDPKESFKLMKQSMSSAPLLTVVNIPKVLVNSFKNYIK